MDVEKIASLAYLKVKNDEKERISSHLEKILHYVEQLNEVPMTADEARSMGQFHILSAFFEAEGWTFGQSLRADDLEGNRANSVAKLNLSNSEALSNSPASAGLPEGLMFEVPSIIER